MAKKTIVYLVSLVLLAICFLPLYFINYLSSPYQDFNYAKFQETAVKGGNEYIGTTNLLVSPDVYWGRALHKKATNAGAKKGRAVPDYAYPFEGLEGFSKIKHDAWIVNLECASVVNVFIEGVSDLLDDINCDYSFLRKARQYFDYTSLANDHTYNQGDESGYLQTRENLLRNGIIPFGNFDFKMTEKVLAQGSLENAETDLDELHSSETIDIEKQTHNCIITSQKTETAINMPFALCGYQFVAFDPENTIYDEIKMYSKYFPVIVMPHSGGEFSSIQTPNQEKRYRKMIDAGADLVLGAHPHIIEPAEVYKDKLIVYSLGNFIMDQIFSQNTRIGVTMNVALSLLKPKTSQSDLYKQNLTRLEDFSDYCNNVSIYNCYSKLSSEDLFKPTYQFSFQPIGTEVNKTTLQTSIANSKTLSIALNSLNWQEITSNATVKMDEKKKWATFLPSSYKKPDEIIDQLKYEATPEVFTRFPENSKSLAEQDAIKAAYSQEIVTLTNDVRARLGLPKLKTASCLESFASKRVEPLASAPTLVHDKFGGIIAFCNSEMQPLNDSHMKNVGENLMRVEGDSFDAVAELLKSPTHFANISSPEFKYTNVSCTKDLVYEKRFVCTQMFLG